MSLSPSFQNTLLSGTLALAAGACAAPNTALRPKESATPSPCSVHNLPDTKETGYAIAVLSQKSLDPQLFYQETPKRFGSLTTCTPGEIASFSQFQKNLAANVAALPLPKIRETVEGLYRRAYAYNAAGGAMTLGTAPDHLQAKKELDLWIAAISHRAYDNEDFLERLTEEGGIGAVISLVSPKLSDADRGELERLIQASKKGAAERDSALLENNKALYKRQFEWLDAYQGKTPFIAERFWLSNFDSFAATSSFFGQHETLRMSVRGFPRGVVRKLLEERGLTRRYDDLAKLSDDALINRFYESQMAVHAATRPAVLRDAAREGLLLAALFHDRGLMAQPILEKRFRDDLLKTGWDAKDADQVIRLQQGFARDSHTRLDNYRGRFAVLREYRSLYTQLVTQPLEAAFAPEKIKRFNVWNNVLVNRDVTGAPVRIEELDEIRKEVRKQSSPWKDASATGAVFASRDVKSAQWLMPKDLGLCGAPAGGVLTHLATLTADGKKLDDLVCQNIELIALLPSARLPEHAAAAAFGVFGIMIARNTGPEAGHDWTPGALTRALSHEAAHIEFFRQNFEPNSRRLTYLGANERRAYATGKGFLTGYLARGSVAKEEKWLEEALVFDRDAIARANRKLGVAEGEMNPTLWVDQWDQDAAAKFQFQPGDLASQAKLEKMLEGVFKPITAEQAATEGERVLKKAVSAFLTDPKDRKEALEALQFVQSSSNTGETFRLLLASHPLSRVVNQLRQEIMGQSPWLVLEADQSAWLSFQNELGRSLLVLVRLQDIRKGF